MVILIHISNFKIKIIYYKLNKEILWNKYIENLLRQKLSKNNNICDKNMSIIFIFNNGKNIFIIRLKAL